MAHETHCSKKKRPQSLYAKKKGLQRQGIFSPTSPLSGETFLHRHNLASEDSLADGETNVLPTPPEFKVGPRDDHWVGGGFYEIRRNGEVWLLVLTYQSPKDIRPGLRLPGGTKEGIETPLETFEREMHQEVAQPGSKLVMHVKTEPIFHKEGTSYASAGATHHKFGVLVHGFEGKLRDESFTEKDRVILGIPYFERIDRILLRLADETISGKARFHLFFTYQVLQMLAHNHGGVAEHNTRLIESYRHVQ